LADVSGGHRVVDRRRLLADIEDSTNDGSETSSFMSGNGVLRAVPPQATQSAGTSESGDSGAGDDFSDASSVEAGVKSRILAASEASDDASSDSASSAGFESFRMPQVSMWSGVSGASSAASSLAEDMMLHRRPLLEGYASALRPLLMTRGDLVHVLAKFPLRVLVASTSASRSGAAHRELLEELFGSIVVAVKGNDVRSKGKLAFGQSFTHCSEPYALGALQTTLCITAHGVRRTCQEPFPVVYEEEHEDEAQSETAMSRAHEAGLGLQGVLEFEELNVPLTQISSRELFLAELMQSDQCQLLASLSQGSHSKYGHRALKRRRRTLRHVREATQLLANVPQ